jgi:putative tricarboxylic transport membrane protein
MSLGSHLNRPGPRQRSVEIGVILFMCAFAFIVIVGSVQVGIGWGAEGPKAGFFPFYVAFLILASSIINLGVVLSRSRDNRPFAEWEHLTQVISLLLPTAIYVALIPWAGIYVASVLLIAVFMKWLGTYGWRMVAAVSIGVPMVTFVIFEKWFLVPLPKGPIEEYFSF